MKILLVAPHPFYQERGTPIAVDLMLQSLSRLGHHVSLLTYHEGGDRDHENVTIHRIDPHMKVKKIRPGFSLKKLYCDVYLFFKLLKMLSKEQYDVVHAVEEAVFMAMVAKWIYKVPYVYDMDSSLSMQFTDMFPIFKFLQPIFKMIESIPVRGARVVIPVCPALQEYAESLGARDVELIPDIALPPVTEGPPIEDLRSTYGIDDSLIMYVGNLQPYQGIFLLLKSMLFLSDQKAKLVIVGGRDDDRKRYMALAHSFESQDRVFFHGPIPLMQLPQYLQQADVLVSPRIQGNNTPMKIYAYMHSGVPVVATNINSHTQVLDMETAVVVDPTPEMFAAGIDSLLSDPDKCRTVAHNAHEFIEHGYTIDRYRKRVSRLYDRFCIDQERSKRKRILVVSYEYPPLGGGGAKVVQGLVDRLIAKEYCVDLVTMGYKGLPSVEQQRFMTIYRTPGIRVHESRCSAIEMIPYLFFAFLKILTLTKKNTYVVNHTHFIFPDGVISSLIRKIRKLPLIVTAHGSDVPGYNPNRFKFLHVMLMPFWRHIVKRIDCIASPSDSLRELIHKSAPTAPVVVIPNGIDVNKFRHDRDKVDRVLCVTRMFERKGIQYVLEALSRIDHGYEIDIVGDGPYLEVLKMRAGELGVKATFHGYMENTSSEFIELYETSRIFVFPSEVENFPIVLLEAMGAGMAIVTTKGTGCAEVVGDSALLVEPRDVLGIRAAIVRIMESNELGVALSRKARKRLIDNFSWEAVADQYINAFRDIMNGNF